MRLVAVIDIREGWNGSGPVTVHLFRSSGRGYEFLETSDAVPGTRPAWAGRVSGCCLSLPAGLLNFRILRLPFSDRPRLREIIPFELDRIALGSPEDLVFDFAVLDGGGDSHDVLVAYAEKGLVQGLIRRFSEMGLEPASVFSLELGSVLSSDSRGIGARLLEPISLEGDDRVRAAAREIRTPAVNLRTGPLAYTGDLEKAGKRFTLAAVLCLLLFLVLDADLLLRYSAVRKQDMSLRKEINSVYSRLFPDDRKITDPLYQMRSRLKEARDTEVLLTGVRPLRQLAGLSDRFAKDIVLDEFVLDRGLVTMKGEAQSLEALERARQRLSGMFRDLALTDTKPGERAVSFTMTGQDAEARQ